MVDQKKPRGIILKEAREAQGITLESVQDTTKIPLDVLKAIEEGYTVKMISPFYFKGFIKMYAQFLHVDVSTVIDDFHKEKLPEPIKEKKESPEVFEKINQLLTKKRKQQLVQLLGTALVIFLIGKIAGAIFFNRKGSGEKASQAEKVKTSAGTAQSKVKKEARKEKFSVQSANKEAPKSIAVKTSAPTPEAATAVTQNLNSPVALTVKAKQNTWLRVNVDGNVVFQSTLKKGTAEVWVGKEKIELSGKDINQLEYEVNGKMLGELGRQDRQARKLIITKDGMTVKQ